MKPTLQLNVSQSLTLTPQLQQAIKLLQLSTLDLHQEIQQALENNPMLEINEDTSDGGSSDTASSTESNTQQDNDDTHDLNSNLNKEDLPKDLPVDSSWEDILSGQHNRSSSSSIDVPIYERQDLVGTSLQAHLTAQLSLGCFSDTDIAIATALIDAINNQGFLSCSLDEIHSTLTADSDEAIEPDEIETVLKRIQQFEPLGVGARDLQECLLLQLSQLPASTPWLHQAKELVQTHMPLLAKRDYTTLAKRLKLSLDTLRQVLQLVQSLNPRPGSQIEMQQAQYVIPDVIVRKDKGCWLVELNSDAVPRLRINADYANLVRRGNQGEQNHYLKDNLQEAKWFLKSLQSRHETLLKVATKIFEHQKAFLEQGECEMRPLILNEIALAIDMHESTISRVTTNKYVETPRGIFELKYFFSSHVSTQDGGERSATAIQALIKQMIAEEDVTKPLSDSKIAATLEKRGINVARRTIAKYREALQIPPSNERKSLV